MARADGQYQAAVFRLRKDVRRVLAANPGSHDWDHTVRVVRTARRLARAANADPAVVECAALLHDVGRAREDEKSGAVCHAGTGAREAPVFLRGAGFSDKAFVRHVAACVRTHRFRSRGRVRPRTPEARVIYDADKLDSMGAIGIGRAFHFAGRIGARVHNTRGEALRAGPYGLQDTAYREFLVKLRHLREAMLTPAGRRMAEDRHRFMKEFFARLIRETRGEDVGCVFLATRSRPACLAGKENRAERRVPARHSCPSDGTSPSER